MVKLAVDLCIGATLISSPASAGVSSDMLLASQKTEMIEVESHTCPSNEDVDELARLIFAEVGSDWIPDTCLYYCGATVLNRVEDEDYPNNQHDVIYQKGQYQVSWTGAMNKTPTDRCYKIARNLLENGVEYYDIPTDLVYFAEWKQGSGAYYTYKNIIFSLK